MENVLCMQFFTFFLKGKNHTDDVQVWKTHKCIKLNALGITGLHTVSFSVAVLLSTILTDDEE